MTSSRKHVWAITYVGGTTPVVFSNPVSLGRYLQALCDKGQILFDPVNINVRSIIHADSLYVNRPLRPDETSVTGGKPFMVINRVALHM